MNSVKLPHYPRRTARMNLGLFGIVAVALFGVVAAPAVALAAPSTTNTFNLTVPLEGTCTDSMWKQVTPLDASVSLTGNSLSATWTTGPLNANQDIRATVQLNTPVDGCKMTGSGTMTLNGVVVDPYQRALAAGGANLQVTWRAPQPEPFVKPEKPAVVIDASNTEAAPQCLTPEGGGTVATTTVTTTTDWLWSDQAASWQAAAPSIETTTSSRPATSEECPTTVVQTPKPQLIVNTQTTESSPQCVATGGGTVPTLITTSTIDWRWDDATSTWVQTAPVLTEEPSTRPATDSECPPTSIEPAVDIVAPMIQDYLSCAGGAFVLDNTGSTVAVTYEINGQSFVVAAGAALHTDADGALLQPRDGSFEVQAGEKSWSFTAPVCNPHIQDYISCKGGAFVLDNLGSTRDVTYQINGQSFVVKAGAVVHTDADDAALIDPIDGAYVITADTKSWTFPSKTDCQTPPVIVPGVDDPETKPNPGGGIDEKPDVDTVIRPPLNPPMGNDIVFISPIRSVEAPHGSPSNKAVVKTSETLAQTGASDGFVLSAAVAALLLCMGGGALLVSRRVKKG